VAESRFVLSILRLASPAQSWAADAEVGAKIDPAAAAPIRQVEMSHLEFSIDFEN
jgi:hypothetical protein